jgi:hypothetical protein
MPQVPEMMQPPPPQMAAEGGIIPGYAHGGIINALPHYADGGFTQPRQQPWQWYQKRDIGLREGQLGVTPEQWGTAYGTLTPGESDYEGYIKREQKRIIEEKLKSGELSKEDYPKPIFGVDWGSEEKRKKRQLARQETEDKIRLEAESLAKTRRETLLEDVKKSERDDFKTILEEFKTKDMKRIQENAKELANVDAGLIDAKNPEFDKAVNAAADRASKVLGRKEQLKKLADENIDLMEELGMGPDKDYNKFQLSMVLLTLGRNIATNKDPNLLTNIMASTEEPSKMLMALAAKNLDKKDEVKKAAVQASLTEYLGSKTDDMKEYEALVAKLEAEDVPSKEAMQKAMDMVWPPTIETGMNKLIATAGTKMFNESWDFHMDRDSKTWKIDNGKTSTANFRNEFYSKLGELSKMPDYIPMFRGAGDERGLPAERVSAFEENSAINILSQKKPELFEGIAPDDTAAKKEVWNSVSTVRDEGHLKSLIKNGTINEGDAYKVRTPDGKWTMYTASGSTISRYGGSS